VGIQMDKSSKSGIHFFIVIFLSSQIEEGFYMDDYNESKFVAITFQPVDSIVHFYGLQ
jgi:hypothetical protein